MVINFKKWFISVRSGRTAYRKKPVWHSSSYAGSVSPWLSRSPVPRWLSMRSGQTYLVFPLSGFNMCCDVKCDSWLNCGANQPSKKKKMPRLGNRCALLQQCGLTNEHTATSKHAALCEQFFCRLHPVKIKSLASWQIWLTFFLFLRRRAFVHGNRSCWMSNSRENLTNILQKSPQPFYRQTVTHSTYLEEV